MEIKADLVKTLREKTGAGFMDCKGALLEAKGDFEKAVEILRIKGIAKAEKKSSKVKEVIVRKAKPKKGKSPSSPDEFVVSLKERMSKLDKSNYGIAFPKGIAGDEDWLVALCKKQHWMIDSEARVIGRRK